MDNFDSAGFRLDGAVPERRLYSCVMSEAEQLSALIGDVYDAALDPARWPDVLAKSARFVGGFTAALFFKDAAGKSGDLFYEAGRVDPH